jgi:hypothetical protein
VFCGSGGGAVAVAVAVAVAGWQWQGGSDSGRVAVTGLAVLSVVALDQ